VLSIISIQRWRRTTIGWDDDFKELMCIANINDTVLIIPDSQFVVSALIAREMWYKLLPGLRSNEVLSGDPNAYVHPVVMSRFMTELFPYLQAPF
jgi:hypothetical protein